MSTERHGTWHGMAAAAAFVTTFFTALISDNGGTTPCGKTKWSSPARDVACEGSSRSECKLEEYELRKSADELDGGTIFRVRRC